MAYDELAHHGIKGQKWGVRRYQNKDGSLTNAGKKRYSNSVDINNMDRKQLNALLKSGNDFVVKKGSEAYRSTNTEHEKTKGKKYVSLRASDIPIYHDLVANETGKIGANVYDVTYSTTKDMKVAGIRTQAEILQKMYGTKSISDNQFKREVDAGRIDGKFINKKISKMTDDELSSYLYYNPFGHDMDILNKPMTNVDTDKYMKELIKKGYDAVVDMEDLSVGYADTPLVILETENSLKRKHVK